MTCLAILGFGTVGQGVADLLTQNQKETEALVGDGLCIRYILDLREFPDSPFADRVVHSFAPVLADPDVTAVIETMGGSHPAYEYTCAALAAGKHVITSNKEAVANFGDKFLRIAAAHGVTYRFEAAVGGGIPVIAPLVSLLRQNRITEVRGILNGTTNYILTKMFSYGDSFEEALADAQRRGFAERNPDADILGTDACRKIAILAALVTGKLFPTGSIHTEGIAGIRADDVRAADLAGYRIRLLGRLAFPDGRCDLCVAPFLLPKAAALAGVSGVYNAVEILGEPVGNVMMYGPGAGAGATASAVVGDLAQALVCGRNAILPVFEKATEGLSDFSEAVFARYLALDRETDALPAGTVSLGGGCYLTEGMSESDFSALCERLGAAEIHVLSSLRVLPE